MNFFEKFNPNIFNKNLGSSQRYTAFTLAEVLITLGIIGIVAAMTIPTLMQDTQNKEIVTGILKFNTNLQNAIALWKDDIGCHDSAQKCLASQGLVDNSDTSFDQISKFLKVSDKALGFDNNKDWLPNITYDYYGNNSGSNWGHVAHLGCGVGCYLLNDGTTFSIDSDIDGFSLMVDVNGKRPPNRVGKDTFPFLIGKDLYKDVSYLARSSNYAQENSTGLCGFGSVCDLNNPDPSTNRAAITSYVILNHKLPDFKALAKTVSGFKP